MCTTVIGKYNQVIHHQPDMDVDSKTPAIQFGVGKDELTRRNAVTIFNDRRMDYDSQRDDSAWHQHTIPDIKWIQENISGGGGGSSQTMRIDQNLTQSYVSSEVNGLVSNPENIVSLPALSDPTIGSIQVLIQNEYGNYTYP